MLKGKKLREARALGGLRRSKPAERMGGLPCSPDQQRRWTEIVQLLLDVLASSAALLKSPALSFYRRTVNRLYSSSQPRPDPPHLAGQRRLIL